MRRPSSYGRDINGIILLDKPPGLSSNNLLQKVKYLFRANKAGHTGSLDPLATGMLPICLGQATKFSQYLLNADKRYRVTARLGYRTDTLDGYGKIISTRPVNIKQVNIEDALDCFRGQIQQVPPMFSAVKYHGKELYKYARKGIAVPRDYRTIHIYDINLITYDNKSIELEICCSKGTYIRTIIDDLGEILGCGAHVIKLKRLSISSYPPSSMITIEKLQSIYDEAYITQASCPLEQIDVLLLPIDSAINDMPTINLPINSAALIRLGQTIYINNNMIYTNTGLLRMTEGVEKRFFGIGKMIKHGLLAPYRLLSTQNI